MTNLALGPLLGARARVEGVGGGDTPYSFTNAEAEAFVARMSPAPTFYNRAELSLQSSGIAGAEVWFSLAVQTEGVAVPNTARTFFQCLQASLGEPVLQMLCQHDSFRIRTYDDANTPVTRHVGDPMMDGEPEQFVLRCVFGPSGELQAWRNGVELINLSGIAMGDTTNTTPKFGVYRSGAADPFVIEAANWEIGGDLSGRVLTPLALPPGW